MRDRFLDVQGSPFESSIPSETGLRAGDCGSSPDWNGYRVGSESCVHLLPDSTRLLADRDIPEGKAKTLVTPVTGPAGLNRVLDLALSVHRGGWEEIVVNDWGVLHELSPVAGEKITAGRLLMRFRRGPGSGDPWPSLDNDSRRYFAWGPLCDGPFLDFLAGMGIGRLEADPPRHWHPLPVLKSFKVSLHAETRLISVSSQCPWLYQPGKDNWSTSAQCPKICRKSGPVLLHSEHLERPLIQRGMEILEDAAGSWREEDLPPEVDRIIYSSDPALGTLNASNL
jgi:hypothetical protein